MDKNIVAKNDVLKYLGKTSKGNNKFIYSKLANELILILTKRCNLNCPFCYDKANLFEDKKLKSELSTQEVKQLIKMCKEVGVKNIRLTGGEPILRNDFLDILSECNGMYVSLCTNGLILKDKITEIVNCHPDDLHIHLSLDGIENHKRVRVGSDPYEIISLIRYIKKTNPKIKVSVNTVISDKNYLELLELYNQLKSTNLDRWTISYPRLINYAKNHNFRVPISEEYSKIIKELILKYYSDNKPFAMSISYFYKHEFNNIKNYTVPKITNSAHPCLPDANGARGLIIDSFGNIIDCLALTPEKKPINIRSVLLDNDIDILFDYLFRSVNNKYYDLRLRDKKECKNCRYLLLCKGGCPVNALSLQNNINNIDVVSCNLFYNFEKFVLPILDEEDVVPYNLLIRKSKSIDSIEKNIYKNKVKLIKIGCFA